MEAGGPLVKAESVHKRFGRLHVLKGIDLEVRAGEVMCIVGPSGSGKSTFLCCINHLEKLDAGRLYVDGDLVGYREKGGKLHELGERDVAARRRDIGMVFQRFNLFPHMTALENVMAAPVWVKKESKATARERALKLIDRVGLGDKADSHPAGLSGGQQQRVAIGPGPRYGAQAHAAGRADLRTRSGAGRRGARRHAPARGGWDDDDRGHPRDRLRARGR